MSTRATYEFVDERGSHTVYKHHDGYPSGGLQWIARALKHAWELPRFEADDFGAAFIAANKPAASDSYSSGGGVRLTTGRDAHGDTEYHYIVICKDGRIFVKIEHLWDKKAEEGFLDDLLDKHAPKREWIENKDEVEA